jgi:hypothetical protein
MRVFLVTYDLNRESKRPPIVDAIREFEGWARLSESSYAVQTALTADQVYQRLLPLLDSNDTLYVIRLSAPWAGQGYVKVNEWLEEAFQLQAARAY